MICAAVKANAYGHGLLPIAQELKSLGVEYLAVANMDEARLLRKEGIAGPILCLGAARAKEITIGLENEAEFTISDKQALQELAAAAKPRKTPVKVHLKVDVGMGRLGCTPDQALDLAKSIHKVPDFDFQGLFTHFPLADNGRTDPTGSQLNQFLEIKDSILQAGIQPHIIHTANSGATFDFPLSHQSMVRPGIALYGYPPSDELRHKAALKPVMELVTRLSLIKDLPEDHGISYGSTYKTRKATKIGVVPVGYGDGYPRHLSNLGKVRVGENTFQIAGRVCMDQFMLDLGDAKVSLETPVCLFGPQGPGADDLARSIGTISYEILTGITQRVQRVYLNPSNK